MSDFRKSLCVNVCEGQSTDTLGAMVRIGETFGDLIERKDAAIDELKAEIASLNKAYNQPVPLSEWQKMEAAIVDLVGALKTVRSHKWVGYDKSMDATIAKYDTSKELT